MLRLCRKVRFAINRPDAPAAPGPAHNSYAAFPSLLGIGHFMLDVTLAGEVNAGSGYMRNIKDIDHAVRDLAVPLANQFVQANKFDGGGTMLLRIFDRLKDAWPGSRWTD